MEGNHGVFGGIALNCIDGYVVEDSVIRDNLPAGCDWEACRSGTCDRYLRELAAMLGLRVRQRDALARLAGDTFALFIENCPEPRARKIAEEIREQRIWLPNDAATIDGGEFYAQLKAPSRVRDLTTGELRYRWTETGALDHYRYAHAFDHLYGAYRKTLGVFTII